MPLTTLVYHRAPVRTETRIMEAFAAGANYVGFGTILSTSSKADTEEAKGLSAPAQMCQVATCSIRGTAKTVPYIMQCGARGFAVISICTAIGPMEAIHQLMTAIKRQLSF